MSTAIFTRARLRKASMSLGVTPKFAWRSIKLVSEAMIGEWRIHGSHIILR